MPTMQTLTHIPTLSTLKRPTHVSHPTIALLVEAMNRADRAQFVHYAGASYRDDHAWQFCLAWIASPFAPHDELNRAALKASGWR